MLFYASEIWGTANIHVIETAHLFACKRLLKVSDKTPNNMIYCETGRYPLLIDSTIRSLRYWLKITNIYAIKSISKASIHYVKKRR